MVMSAKHRSKFAAIHRLWWRIHLSEKILEWDYKPNKQQKALLCWPEILTLELISVMQR